MRAIDLDRLLMTLFGQRMSERLNRDERPAIVVLQNERCS